MSWNALIEIGSWNFKLLMYQHCIVKEVVKYRGLRSEKGIFSDPADISNNAEEMVLKEANLVENIL